MFVEKQKQKIRGAATASFLIMLLQGDRRNTDENKEINQCISSLLSSNKFSESKNGFALSHHLSFFWTIKESKQRSCN